MMGHCIVCKEIIVWSASKHFCSTACYGRRNEPWERFWACPICGVVYSAQRRSKGRFCPDCMPVGLARIWSDGRA